MPILEALSNKQVSEALVTDLVDSLLRDSALLDPKKTKSIVKRINKWPEGITEEEVKRTFYYIVKSQCGSSYDDVLTREEQEHLAILSVLNVERLCQHLLELPADKVVLRRVAVLISNPRFSEVSRRFEHVSRLTVFSSLNEDGSLLDLSQNRLERGQ